MRIRRRISRNKVKLSNLREKLTRFFWQIAILRRCVHARLIRAYPVSLLQYARTWDATRSHTLADGMEHHVERRDSRARQALVAVEAPHSIFLGLSVLDGKRRRCGRHRPVHDGPPVLHIGNRDPKPFHDAHDLAVEIAVAIHVSWRGAASALLFSAE